MTAPLLSNALAHLAERVRAAVDAHTEAERASAVHVLAAGAMLLEARSQSTHGAWGAFLERAGVHERQARRLIRLARSGLKPDTVSDLGGVKATLAWMRGLTRPGPGKVLIAQTSGTPWDSPFAVVVPGLGDNADAWQMARAEGEYVDTFNRAVTASGFMPVLFLMMDGHLPKLTFNVIDDDDGFWGDFVRGQGPFADAP